MKKQFVVVALCIVLFLSSNVVNANEKNDLFTQIEQIAPSYSSEIEIYDGMLQAYIGVEHDPFLGGYRYNGGFIIKGYPQFETTNQFTIAFKRFSGTSSFSIRKYWQERDNFIEQVLLLAGVPVTKTFIEDLNAVDTDNYPQVSVRKYGDWEVTITPNKVGEQFRYNQYIGYNSSHQIMIKRTKTPEKPIESTTPSNSNIQVILNGTQMKFNQPPIIINNFTLVPLRDIFEGLGANVHWEEKTKSVKATKGNIQMQLWVDSTDVYINNKLSKSDVAPVIINGYTFVPLRVIAETFGADIGWDGATKTITIKTPNNEPSDIGLNNVQPSIEKPSANSQFTDNDSNFGEAMDTIKIYSEDLNLGGQINIIAGSDFQTTQLQFLKQDSIFLTKSGEDEVFVTDSEDTDTTFLLHMKRDQYNRIKKASFNDFERERPRRYHVVTNRGIRIGESKASKVFEEYGTETASVRLMDPYPDGSRIVIVEYVFEVIDSDIYGVFEFYVGVNKNQQVVDGRVYGFSYEILN